MRTLRLIAFVVIVGTITAVALVVWKRGSSLWDNTFGPSNGCSASVDGHNVQLDTSQGQYASIIAAVAVQRGLPPRAVSIALATAYQESKIQNLPGGDRDSLGLFQQRPSMGWGTHDQLMDPVYATNAFYNALVKITNYTSIGIGVAAQDVQHSADNSGDSYQQHADDARALASALTGYSPGGFSCVVVNDNSYGNAADVMSAIQGSYGSAVSPQRSVRENVTVPVESSTAGQRLGWSVAQYSVAMAAQLHIKSVLFNGKKWVTGKNSSKDWTSDRSASSTTVSIVMQ
ncbi:MAG TPA: hypothetical protein VN108_03800 [Marmoricola sp.]|nr:hypothetical protein [Marmoricola sp.]